MPVGGLCRFPCQYNPAETGSGSEPNLLAATSMAHPWVNSSGQCCNIVVHDAHRGYRTPDIVAQASRFGKRPIYRTVIDLMGEPAHLTWRQSYGRIGATVLGSMWCPRSTPAERSGVARGCMWESAPCLQGAHGRINPSAIAAPCPSRRGCLPNILEPTLYAIVEEHMSESKARWIRPQLIVLARGTLDESVLTHCKAIAAPIYTWPSSYQDGCGAEQAGSCAACQARGGS